MEPESISPRAVELTVTTPTTLLKYYGLQLYAIHRTSLEQTPNITLVGDVLLNEETNITLIDTGNNVIKNLSVEEFLYLGGELIIPQSMEAKDNYLFFANYYYNSLTLPSSVDFRAYAHNSSGQFSIINADGSNQLINQTSYTYSGYETHDAVDNEMYNSGIINKEYKAYRFQIGGTTTGGTGANIEYEITKSTSTIDYELDQYNVDPAILYNYLLML